MEFGITNNVEIVVKNKKTNKIKKRINVHNKATRNMVEGIMRFLCGNFTETSLQDSIQYSSDIAEKYIPLYIGFGVGGIKTKVNNVGQIVQVPVSESIIAPQLDSMWSSYVNYGSTKLSKEVYGKREMIKAVTDTFNDLDGKYIIVGDRKNESEMDSIMFYCKVEPETLQYALDKNGDRIFNSESIFISELGIFSSGDSDRNDMLAHVKLNNYKTFGSDKLDSPYESENALRCRSGFMTFEVPDDVELEDGSLSIRGIQRGSFKICIGGSGNQPTYVDTQNVTDRTKGFIYHVSDLEYPVGLIDYQYGIVRFYDTEISGNNFFVKYNVERDLSLDTDIIYITKDDSIIVRWVITLAAIGKDNLFKKSVKGKSGYETEYKQIIPEHGSQINSV